MPRATGGGIKPQASHWLPRQLDSFSFLAGRQSETDVPARSDAAFPARYVNTGRKLTPFHRSNIDPPWLEVIRRQPVRPL